MQKADAAEVSLELLEKVGLDRRARARATGYYDRFRDRVHVPDPRRAGPDRSASAAGFCRRRRLRRQRPKYYNSADTPLFTKSEHLYGLDQARQAAAKAGYLAVVEGYTDVLMAHQHGRPQVVATMGTALNARHVRKLRGACAARGAGLRRRRGRRHAASIGPWKSSSARTWTWPIATLPDGLDPCDLLVQQGPEPFRQVLDSAVDALEFKLNQVLAAEEAGGVEGRRRAVDAVLGVIALAPSCRTGGAVKMRVDGQPDRSAAWLSRRRPYGRAWNELRATSAAPRRTAAAAGPKADDAEAHGAGRPGRSGELLEVLLADPALVAAISGGRRPEEIGASGPAAAAGRAVRLQAEGRAA